ncbi:MAG: hypothetical protein GQ582_01075 [Methyloprofundus sp.]|nr:hypothetical protein [Methyloprofundus sp.]
MLELKGYKIEKSEKCKSEESSYLLTAENKKIAEVPGHVLEAFFRLKDDRYLVLLTDNLPYEECLHIVLLDSQYCMLDQVDIYQAYTSGILSNVKILGDFELVVDFLENQQFHVMIAVSPSYSIRRIYTSDPIHYARRFNKCYLTVNYTKSIGGEYG